MGKGMGVREITASCWFQHQLRAQGRTCCSAPKWGSRLSWDAGLSRDLIRLIPVPQVHHKERPPGLCQSQ